MPADPPLFPSTIFDKTERWFERAKASLLGQIPCKQGCTRCCIGSFPVTLVDRKEIRRGLRTLPEEARHEIQGKAARQVSLIEKKIPRLARDRFLDHWADREIDQVVGQCSDLPCPALEPDGSCGLYAFRPLACRSMGIPSDEAGLAQGACEVQTSIPLIRLSQVLRREEGVLAQEEAVELSQVRRQLGASGEELLLPYAFLAERGSPRFHGRLS